MVSHVDIPILVDQPDELSLDDFSAGISGYEDIAFLPIEKIVSPEVSPFSVFWIGRNVLL
ncbi:MAG: hypothetical protein IPP25_17720 [Saprospiraceae bacterium]|nr:hypothetical protein [Candidatus Opimibacter skivensis]